MTWVCLQLKFSNTKQLTKFMKKERFHYQWQPWLSMAAAGVALAVLALSADAQIVLGPTTPIQTADGLNWFSGSSGVASVSVTDQTFPYNSDTYDAVLSNSGASGPSSGNHADFRSAVFPLGQAAKGAQTVDFSFYYYASNVNAGDNIRVDL